MGKTCKYYVSGIFLICCIWLVAYCDVQQNGNRIGSIKITGNHGVSNNEILSKVHSRVGEFFDQEVAKEDARRIAELSGVEYSFYNTVVVDGKIQLTFVVGERNIIRSIGFEGNHKYKDKKLRAKTGLKVGDYLDAVVVQSAKETLTDFYLKKGFAFVEIILADESLISGELDFTVTEGPRVKIESVRITGNDKIKTAELKRAAKLSRKKLLFWTKYYNEKSVDDNLQKLQNIYHKQGFLNSSITVRREFNKDKSKVRLIFVITEGPVYSIDTIAIKGAQHFTPEHLRQELKSESGKVYSEAKADSDVKQLLKLYHEIGFIDVRVEKNIQFVAEDKVSVGFDITEGQRFRIGVINITGNEQTQDKVIRRVLDEYDFRPGRWYNADIARGDVSGSGYLEKLIRRTVYADSATITPAGSKPGQRDAQVSIVEGQTGSIMLGGGIASNSGGFAQFVYEQRNFDISDTPENFREFITGKAFRGAGQTLRLELRPGTQEDVYLISFTEPYFQNKPISLDVVGSSYARGRESYDEERTKGYVGFEKRYKNRWRRSLGFRVEDVDVGNLEPDAPKEITDIKGSNMLFGARFGIGRDLTDDRFNPSSGNRFDAGYEQVGGDHTFGILSGTWRWYKTLYEDLAEQRTILGTKLHAATTVGNAPPFEKFYAGGQGSLRGFDYRGVSTRGRNPVTGKLDDPIGSDWIFLANAEVVTPLVSENFAALFFVDSGIIDSGDYRAAVGTGIQIMLPHWFGPVPMRFELAQPFMKDGDDETQIFSFSVGRLF